jgi:hypothetical protein
MPTHLYLLTIYKQGDYMGELKLLLRKLTVAQEKISHLLHNIPDDCSDDEWYYLDNVIWEMNMLRSIEMRLIKYIIKNRIK